MRHVLAGNSSSGKVSSRDADSVQINLGCLSIPCYDSPAWGKGSFSFQPGAALAPGLNQIKDAV
jgi:hypothetical protein